MSKVGLGVNASRKMGVKPKGFMTKTIHTEIKRLNKREHQQETKLYQHVGKAVVTQSNIEGLLGFIYFMLSSPSERAITEKKFIELRSFHKRLEATTELIRVKCSPKASQKWAPIRTELNDYRRLRNKLAHNAISRVLTSKRKFVGVYLSKPWYLRRSEDERISPAQSKKLADNLEKTRKKIWRYIFDGLLDP
jgi:hypothetical protein